MLGKIYRVDDCGNIYIRYTFARLPLSTNECKVNLLGAYEVVDRKGLYVYKQLWMNKLRTDNENNAFDIVKRAQLIQKLRSREIYKLK